MGYLICESQIPIGFMVFSIGEVKDVSEFYIIPAKRLGGHGRNLASSIFVRHPGRWQVRQICGADSARLFWRKVISCITKGNYREEEIEDAHWGRVSRQSFEIAGSEK